MFIFLKKFSLVLVALMLVAPLRVNAADNQFYFVARQAPAGSITADGQSQSVIYLRWDTVEGELPADVIGLRLLRNGVPVSADFPTNSVMPISAINALYQGGEQQRRKQEIITRLNELAAARNDGNFSATNFASYLHGLLNPAETATYNPFWAFFASRTDFNIARARYRGWIDTSPGNAIIEYELQAVNASGVTARLGFTRVQPGVAINLLGATELRQIFNSDTRCDMPENAKDHYTVALNWNSPGETINTIISDRVAAQFYISGFDLYRSSSNLAADVTTAPVRDIAALAAQSASDARGNPQITGLEKVNLSLVVDSGSTNDEPKWQETRDLLQRAGLKPGDRRAYYLVPRDFTGNYGPTIETIVEVPLMTRPPAPWNIRTFADETSSAITPDAADALTLSWDKVNLDNYVRMFQDSRRYCNLLEAQQTGVLEFVGIDQNCDSDVRSSVRLDVVDYRIYRFTDFDVAGRFKDSDGDGVADSDERVAGLQCDAASQPATAPNYLASNVELLAAGGSFPGQPEIVRLRDKVPAANKDTVYWYRIASVTGSGENSRLSFLSAPQRGLFPDRTPPREPLVEVLKPGTVATGCELISTPTTSGWSFEEKLSPARENPLAFNLTCNGSTQYSLTGPDIASGATAQCQDISKTCLTNDVSIAFPATAATGGNVCNVTLPGDVNICWSGNVSLVPTYEGALVAAQPGDLVPGGVTVNVVPQDAQTCVALYENIDGTSTRIGHSCDPAGLSHQAGDGLFCGYAVATDQNNNISTAVLIPCTLAPANPKAPGSPQILSFEVDESQARFSFRLPAEEIAVTMVRLDHEVGDGSTKREISTVPAINYEPGQIISLTLPVAVLQVTKDRLCLSLQAVARDTGTGQPSLTSPWSKPRCYTRLAGGAEDLPQYLPWPTVNSPDEGAVLAADLINDYRKVPKFLMMQLAGEVQSNGECERVLPGQIAGEPATPELLLSAESSNQFDKLECTDVGMAAVRAALSSQLDFILYRQSRIVGGIEGSWIQVSPLIEFAHFDDIPSRPRQDKNASSIEWRLNDPFVKFMFDANQNTLNFIFLDRYPFATTADLLASQPYEFRYQAVYFDQKHRPLRWRQSGWFQEVK